MENLIFMLWMVLYPVSSSVTSYLATKERKLNNEEPFSKSVRANSALIHIVIWVIIGLILYK